MTQPISGGIRISDADGMIGFFSAIYPCGLSSEKGAPGHPHMMWGPTPTKVALPCPTPHAR